MAFWRTVTALGDCLLLFQNTFSDLDPLAGDGHGVVAVGIGLDRRWAVLVQVVDSARNPFEVRRHYLVESDHPAHVDRRPAHDIGQLRHGRLTRLVVVPVVANRIQEHVPLGLPGGNRFGRGLPGKVVLGEALIFLQARGGGVDFY